MTARDWLPAHLVPASRDPRTGWREGSTSDVGDTVLTFGTPPSPAVRLAPEPPPIVTIRPSGPHSSELLIVQGATQTVVPLSWGHLINLAHEVASGLERHKETR